MLCCLSLTPTLLLRPYSSMLLEKPEIEGVQDTTATHIIYKDVTETVIRAELKVGDHNDRCISNYSIERASKSTYSNSLEATTMVLCSGTSATSSKRVNNPHKLQKS